MDAGADVNLGTKYGGCPSSIASAAEGHQDVVKLLLKFGVDTAIKDNKGMTALMWADKLHHTGIVNLLKQN